MPDSRPHEPQASETIAVRGAAEHNLQRVDVDLPKNRLVVFTGVSGSGKSSLAFDTLYAEGQRRYVESLSSYARQFLGQMERPRYDSIRGLSPTIAIEQKSASANPRSTVGTTTEIYDYLRVLFARVGHQHCTSCGRPVTRQDPAQIVREIRALPEGTRFLLLAPLVRERKGTFADVLEEARQEGFARVRIDGAVHEMDRLPLLDKNRKHSLDLVIDRLVARRDDPDGARTDRLVGSVETALRHGDGRLVVAPADGPELLFSEAYACDYCHVSFPEPSPQLFSFNSPLGMCPACNGLGTALRVDPGRIVPDPSLSIADGAVEGLPTASGDNGFTMDILRAVAKGHGIDLHTPWKDLAPEQQRALVDGSDRDVDVEWKKKDGRGGGHFSVRWEGVAPRILRLYKETQSEAQRRWYGGFLSNAACDACGGSRLRPEARAVRVAGVTLPELVARPVVALAAFFRDTVFAPAEEVIAADLRREILSRLRFLGNVGLGYLTLDRTAGTLSGGEAQRIRLASQIGSELTGVLYVLDEPSIGLHQRDNARLIQALEDLRDLGNTVLVVEHDEATMRAADHLVDFGPGAGREGGRVLYSGPPEGIAACAASLTGRYLSGAEAIPRRAVRRRPAGWLTVRGARANNLKDIDVRFPLGVFTVVTGVSGAGKSTLVNEILHPALARRLHRAMMDVGDHDGIDGTEALDKIIDIDQRPIGRTPRSNPATYTKLFDHIRDVFAQTREAKMHGYLPGRFSFNVKGGRCEACGGDGMLKVEMHFLPDVYVPCPECKGRRFNDATLKVHYRGKSIAEVLDMTVDEALEVFASYPAIRRILATLEDVGLGYIQLGQPSPTLSGGEAQRVKLSRELARSGTGRTLYVLDEPSTGLHFEDTRKLLAVVDRLVEAGNTVVMIEHNLEIVRTADHVIDLGPEGGQGGGRVVAQGTPEEVARVAASFTGAFLARILPAAPGPPAADAREGRAVGNHWTPGEVRS
jgi:excinuclease ABC subunit A